MIENSSERRFSDRDTAADAAAYGRVDPNAIRSGMEVVAADGAILGTVKEVRDVDFLLDRPLMLDLYVPFTAIHEVVEDRVVLHVASDEIGDQGWLSALATNTIV